MNSVRSIIHSLSSWDTWMLWIGGKRGYASLKSFSWSFLWVNLVLANSTNTWEQGGEREGVVKDCIQMVAKLVHLFSVDDVTLCLRRTMSCERRMRPQSFGGWTGEWKVKEKLKSKCGWSSQTIFSHYGSQMEPHTDRFTRHHLHNNWEAVVIGWCVTQNINNGPYFLNPVQAGDRRTHHLSTRRH